METIAINVKHLRKCFNQIVAVENLNLDIYQGEIFGFVGPNGSGKTTTIRMLCGLLIPDAGYGTCLGYDLLTESEAIKANLGYMTQQFSLYEDLSVYENLKFAAQLYPLSNKKKRIKEMMEQFELTPRRNQLAATLSGGWKQRLALSIALLHQPKLLLLDEPTSGVDLQARREFWANIETFASQGVTALVSTHYMDEVIRCHRLAYISYGEVLAKGSSTHLLKQSTLSAWFIFSKNWRQALPYLEDYFAHWQMTPQQNGLRVILLPDEKLPDISGYGLQWNQVELNFEDYFVGLMQQQELPTQK